MIKRKLFSLKNFLLLFLLATLLSSSIQEDTCPSGMRKMYLDETTAFAAGSARNFIPALNFYEGNGALWYNRKILIEPRFEVHLKANIEPTDIVESSAEQVLEGFTIVISNAKNTVGHGSGDTIGYFGFTKSYVMEFDFNKNGNDPDSSSYSLRYCDTDCSSDDSQAIIKGRLSNQRFDPTKVMNWDFRLVYIDHVLTVYSGPNEQLLSYEVDLQEKFGSYIANIGFTGYMKGNRRELSLSGTFVCEDNYDMSKIDGKFYVKETAVDTADYRAGQKVMYMFQFKNNKGQVIPHCYKTNIWTYDFSLVVDCTASNYQISVKDDYNLFLSMNACSEIGKHEIRITEKTHGDGLIVRTYNILSGDVAKISLIGHDGQKVAIPTLLDSARNAQVLKYGPLNGDFSLTSSLTVTLDFSVTDTYGNTVNLGDTSSEMLDVSQMSLVNNNGAKVTMAKKDDHYQLIIQVANTGTYQIVKNQYMTESYAFTVRAGGIDAANSYCTIEGVMEPPTKQAGDHVFYTCYFKDSSGNAITASDFTSMSEYEFQCGVSKKSSTDSLSVTISTQNTAFQCEHIVGGMGEYSFAGYIVKKGSSTKTELPAKINNFSVSPSFNLVSLLGAKIYNPNSRLWFAIDSFSFNYKADSTGFITAIDLTDSDHSTLISSFGKYPSDFAFNKMEALLLSPHDQYYSKKLLVKRVDLYGKEYIGIYTADGASTDEVIKKSSYDYQLRFIYSSIDKTVTMKYKFSQPVTLGTYTTCFHDLNPKYTTINFDSVSLTANNVKAFLGTMELRTNDKNLYNYDVGTSNIQLKLQPSNSNVKFEVEKNVVLGTYNVYGQTSAQFSGTIYFYINNVQADKTVGAKSGKGKTCYLKWYNPEFFTWTRLQGNKDNYYKPEAGAFSDNYLDFYFRWYDCDWFPLKMTNINDYYKEIYGNYGQDTRVYSCLWDYEKEAFHFRHTKSEYRNDLWYCFHAQDTNYKYCIEFAMKSGGSTSITYSFYTLLQTKINVGETAFVEVTLKDTNNVLLGQTTGALDNAKNAISVKATSGSYNYNLQFDSINSAKYTVRYKYTYDIEGVYTVTATFNGQELKCSDKILNVIMEKISLQNSIMYIILDSAIQMSTSSTQTIQNTIQIPRYRLTLYNSENKALSSYDQNVEVTCVMTHESNTDEKYDLVVDKQDSFIDFIHDSQTQDTYPKLVKGDYYLTVTVGTENKKYKLFLVGTEGSEDASNDPEFDPTKTEFNVYEIDGQAGTTYPVTITFKTADGGRWNNEGTLSKFSFSNSYDLNDDKLTTIAQKGSKNGVFIININQKLATTGKKGNVLTITYDGKQLTSQIIIYMKCSALFNLKYESGNRDGTVIDLPTLKFIPLDKYGNIYTDLFDASKTDQNAIDRLTRGKSLDSVALGTNNYLTENQYLNVQYQTKVATTIQVTSDYFSETYTYRIRSGPISTNYTYAELKTSGKLAAGSTHDLMIYPRDEFMNVIDNLNEDDLKKFVVHYEVIGSSETFDFTDKCKLVEGYTSSIDVIERRLVEEEEKSYNMIQCSTPVDSVGSIQFYVDYVEQEVECRSCLIALRANEIEFENLQTVYTNKDTVMKTTETTQIENSPYPKFEVTFHDTFDNVITDPSMVEKVELTAELGGADVKLCVSNSGNKKLITVCPPSNGDDNYNKWMYLTNGDDYSLILKGPSTITYPLELTGGYTDGSSGPVDLTKTYLNPTELTLVAGDEGLVLMEMRTEDNKRKNYWYPNIAETISIAFTADQDTCSYTLAKGEKPGQYNIKFKCTKKTNSNSFGVTVENKPLTQKVNFVIKPGFSYYLEAADPTLFEISGNKFTFKTNPVNGEKVTFNFKLLDMYKNYIDNPFGETKTSVLSELKGTDANLYAINYETNSYLFTDKIDEYLEKHTWDIECLLSGNKYYFTYSKVPGPVDPMKSDFTIDKIEYLVKDTSTVEVTLRDAYGVNVGIVAGRLEREKQYLTVQATGESKTLTYEFDSITTKNTLLYKYTFQNIGKYVVTAEYNKVKIANKGIDITVTYQKYSPTTSQLYLEGTDLMYTTSATTINNLEKVPFYDFYFYTPEGKKITTYDKSIPITCQMKKNDYTWELDVTKEDGLVKFTYKDELEDEFKKLPKGEYQLIVTVDNTPLTYPLLLLGEAGSEDASLSDIIDYTKTLVKPLYIEGVAGNSYDISIEFRASDGLRWNNEVQLSQFTFKDSYNLYTTKMLVISKELGAKKGQCILHVTQYKATTGQPDNVLTIYYEGKPLTQQVSLNMKANKLDQLQYVSGKIEGTVIDLPYLVFTPLDAYDNICTDLFDPTITDDKTLQELTTGISKDGYPLTTNNTIDGEHLNVQYITPKSTSIDVTSPYFPETYTLTIKSGPIDPDTTYAELVPKEDKTAGSTQELIIYPKDVNGNDVDDLSEDDVDKFKVSYEEVGTPNKHDVSDTCKLVEKTIKCTTPVKEAGEIQFHVEYVDDPVRCDTCLLNITPNKVDFSKTSAIYLNGPKELSTTEKTQVEASSLPTFELTFHDEFNNVITDKTVTEKIETKPYFLDTDIDLCIDNKEYHKLVTVCKSEDGENQNKWYYLTEGDNYNLKLTREDEEVKYPIEIIEGISGGSSGKIDPDKTNLNPTALTLTAGVEDKTVLELRTEDDLRRNYWYLKPEDHIKVSFEKDQDTCSYHLNQAEKQGQYYIYFKCTKKVDSNEVTVTIDGEEVPQKVILKVVPAGPAKALLFDMKDNQITQQDLGSVSVEEQYKLKEILFDEYDNRITEITFATTALGITFNPVVEKRRDSEISATPVIQATGEIIITLKSTLAGEHLLNGNYFPLANYTILFTHGQACAQNSLLEVEKTKIMAGETDKVYIFPYDKYNNKIDASIYKDNSPYQVDYVLEGTTVKTPITQYAIEKVNDENVIAYSAEFTKTGIDTAYGYIETEQAKCVSCTITVGAANVEFTQNDYKRLESSSNTFEQIKDGIVEKNTKEAPIYRIYPIDSFGNAIETIPEEKLKTYTCHLVSQKDQVEYYFKLNNEQLTNQPYAEFVKDDKEEGQYANLVGGQYDLIFSDGEDEVKFLITLEGRAGDSDASNKEPEIQNTHLNSFNLKYVAGQKGDMYIELRTEDMLRRNSWNGYDITVESCNKEDSTFKYQTERAGTLGVFYVTVTTKKANTYPKLVECPLTIKVNGEEVKNLHPLMEVSPATIQSTEILSDYYKDPTSSKVLKDGNADSNYPFEVKSFDIYGNLCPTVEETVGIKVHIVGEEAKTVSSDVPETGFRKYIVSTTIAGTYTVTSAMNPAKGASYLPNDSIFEIYPGELSRVEIEALSNEIRAGQKPAVVIQGFDKNDNQIKAKDFKDKFDVKFNDPKSEIHEAINEVDTYNENKAVCTSKTPVTVVGYVTATADNLVTKDKVDTAHIKILVVPDSPDPSKSVLSRELSTGAFEVYKNGDSFTVDVNELLILNVTLYDTYGNLITEIPTDASIINPTMSGNDMEPITFDVANKKTYFKMDYSNYPTYINTFTHLVSGNYDLTYEVESELGKAPFKYTIVINTGKDDSTHGNGPVCLDKCILTPTDVEFYAGEFYTLTLELRTNTGLLFNQEIDPDDVDVVLNRTDPSFKYSVRQAGNELGIYSINIYSEKKGFGTVNVLIYSTDKKQRKNAGPVRFRVRPQKIPFKNYTQILTQPEPQISSDSTIEISFLLFDKFGNQFEERDDIIKNQFLSVTNNENLVKEATKAITNVEDGNKFSITLPVIYPPRKMHINTVYNDGSNSVICFPEDVVTEINVDIDNTLTKVTSKNALKIKVGDLLDMQLYVYDHNGICLDSDDFSSLYKIEVTGPLESTQLTDKKVYYVERTEDSTLECQNKYNIITTSDDKYTKTGTYKIKVTGGDYTVASYTQTCYTDSYSVKGFLLNYPNKDFNPDEVQITDTISFVVSGGDEYGNEFNDPLIDDMTMALTDSKEHLLDSTEETHEKIEDVAGKLQFNVNVRKVDDLQLHLYYKEEEVLTVNWGEKLPIFHILEGECRAESNEGNIDLSPLDDAEVNKQSYFLIHCHDIYGNPITHGGEKFTSTGALIVNEIQTKIDTEVVDNNDGSYTVKFKPPLAGTYVFGLLVDNEKYGQDITFDLKATLCEGVEPYRCPNQKKCVSNRIKCIVPENDCDPETPFECVKNGVMQCVKSMNECDCPSGFKRCTWTDDSRYSDLTEPLYCVPEDREDMCPMFMPSDKLCKRIDQKYVMFKDGICRYSGTPSPSMPVCPIGKVLCADLSCRNNYYECFPESNGGSPYCQSTENRCVDQTCVKHAKYCPSLITCSQAGYVACPDGKCVENEAYCDPIPECTEEVPYLCANLQCVDKQEYCSKNVACGDGKSLCEDKICRVSCSS